MSEKPVATLVAALAIAPICAVCILGPALVGSALAAILGWFVGLGAVGLSAWLGWLDYVLIPALAVFVLMAVYGIVRRARAPSGSEAERL